MTTTRSDRPADELSGAEASRPPSIGAAGRAVDAAGMTMPFDAQGSTGGDWWDLVALPSGELVALFGDAMGHGVAVANQARALSSLARSLVGQGHDDHTILGQLDQSVRADPAAMAALVIARLRPQSGELRVVQAGHLPVTQINATGAIATVPALVAPPLGAGLTTGQAPTIRLNPADTLVFVSDGVVSRRHIPFDTGIAALHDVLGHCHGHPLHQLCAAALCSLLAPLDDDATVLALRWTPPDRYRESAPTEAGSSNSRDRD